jgi:hypothetical protein
MASAAALALAGPARAALTPMIAGGAAPDTPDAHVDPNVAESAFTGVVSLSIVAGGRTSMCSGTLVSSFNVISAGHCVDPSGQGVAIDLSQPGNEVQVIFNSSGTRNAVIGATAVALDPHFQGFGHCPAGSAPGATCVNDDLAVITLASAAPDSAQAYRVWGASVNGAVPITMVGYGRSGSGDIGYTTSGSLGVKRWGQNYGEYYERDDEQVFAGGANEVWYADFDGPAAGQNLFCDSPHSGDWGHLCAPSLANDREATLGGGDSGGAAFMQLASGETVLLGNTTFVGNYDGQTLGTFGTYFGGVLTGGYREFLLAASNGSIQLAVPEPRTGALMVLGLLGIACRLRHRGTAAGR